MKSWRLNWIAIFNQRSKFATIALKQNTCGLITLNQHKTLNALTQDLIKSLKFNLDKCKNDNAITHLIIQGSDKAFCAGGDIKQVAGAVLVDQNMAYEYTLNEYSLYYWFYKYPKPTVALVNGYVLGGGCGVALYNDFIVASESTKIGTPETSLGFFPDASVSYKLSRLKYNVGFLMGLTGYQIIGAQNQFLGIATHYVQKEKMKNLIKDLSEVNCETGIKDVLNNYHNDNDILQCKEVKALQELLPLINDTFNGSSVEEIIQNLSLESKSSKRTQFEQKWCQNQINTLAKVSPTAMRVTFNMIQRSKSKSLDDVFIQDCRMAKIMLYYQDFVKGVATVLGDKSQRHLRPDWKPATLEEAIDICDPSKWNYDLSDEDLVKRLKQL